MSNIYDLFTKKKVDRKPDVPITYQARMKKCLLNIQKNGMCKCDSCLDKAVLSNRLFDITRYLCTEYTDKTGKTLYVADVLEIVLIVAAKLKIEISK